MVRVLAAEYGDVDRRPLVRDLRLPFLPARRLTMNELLASIVVPTHYAQEW
jgi:hypothetical protein